MPIIERLPESVFSRIAAGEVIERPASMLKELLENSLDAGAEKISVESTGAGRKSLLVSDDGKGMDRKDCAMALERHATSKISSLEDLSRLDTFGFRGEALYAVAAVSRLTLRSCARGSKEGWKLEAEAGKVINSGPAPAVPGTTIEVRDLFFNTPARLKFLKSDAFERGRLTAALEEAALANPQVAFTLKNEGRSALRVLKESATDPLTAYRRRAESVLGKEAAGPLLSAVVDRPEVKLWMYLSPSDELAATRNLQFWFVNRRPISSRTLQQALYRAYQDYRSRDRHPVCVAHLELNPSLFDVNVHPGKREVRFHSDRELHELIYSAASTALAKARPAPALLGGAQPIREVRPSYASPAHVRTDAYETSLPLRSEPAAALEAPFGSPRWFTPPYRFLGQIERAYLVFEASGGLFVMDQHAAAERILYEKYLGEIENGRPKSQKLLLPLALELPASRVHEVLSHKEALRRLGFEIAPFGKTGIHVLAAPALFSKGEDLKGLAHRLLDSVAGPGDAARDQKKHAVATIACKAAVKAHDPLGAAEALRLVEDLKDCKDGSCCPHGRRAILSLDREELARRFQRPGAPPL